MVLKSFSVIRIVVRQKYSAQQNFQVGVLLLDIVRMVKFFHISSKIKKSYFHAGVNFIKYVNPIEAQFLPKGSKSCGNGCKFKLIFHSGPG